MGKIGPQRAQELKPYRPSSGTEGMMFTEKWCERCARYGEEGEGCNIWLLSCIHSTSHPDYPKEWVTGDRGATALSEAMCTAFTTVIKHGICSRCRGLGFLEVDASEVVAATTSTCPDCRGKGWVDVST